MLKKMLVFNPGKTEVLLVRRKFDSGVEIISGLGLSPPERVDLQFGSSP